MASRRRGAASRPRSRRRRRATASARRAGCPRRSRSPARAGRAGQATGTPVSGGGGRHWPVAPRQCARRDPSALRAPGRVRPGLYRTEAPRPRRPTLVHHHDPLSTTSIDARRPIDRGDPTVDADRPAGQSAPALAWTSTGSPVGSGYGWPISSHTDPAGPDRDPRDGALDDARFADMVARLVPPQRAGADRRPAWPLVEAVAWVRLPAMIRCTSATSVRRTAVAWHRAALVAGLAGASAVQPTGHHQRRRAHETARRRRNQARMPLAG